MKRRVHFSANKIFLINKALEKVKKKNQMEATKTHNKTVETKSKRTKIKSYKKLGSKEKGR